MLILFYFIIFIFIVYEMIFYSHNIIYLMSEIFVILIIIIGIAKEFKKDKKA